MGDFTQPQQKYAGIAENCNIVIPVIFYPVIKTLRKFLCLLKRCVSTQIWNLRAKINFANMLKIVQKSCNYLIFGQFLAYLQNCFLLSNLISESLHPQMISTTIFIKLLLLDKKWQGLQYCNFHQYQHIFAVARWNHPYDIKTYDIMKSDTWSHDEKRHNIWRHKIWCHGI